MRAAAWWITDEAIAELRAGWARGDSAGTIGLALGISKNSVISKAHRLGLPARPSPIKGRTAAAPARLRPVPRARHVPALVELAAAPPVAAPPPVQGRPATLAEMVHALHPPVDKPPPVAGRVRGCCWPGDELPGRPRFRFCDAPAEPGRPYCAEHAALAYQGWLRRRTVADHASGERARSAYAEIAGQSGRGG